MKDEIFRERSGGFGGAPSCSTPVVSWKEEETQITIIKGKVCTSTQKASARKLGAALWEFHHYSSMHRHLHHPVDNSKGDAPHGGFPDHHHEPASSSSPRRHITASLMRHNQSATRNHHALHPLSPASYGSSLEMAPYNPAGTPGVKRRTGESSYGFKTSTELLKVLNRIWTLEEQHTSNKRLVKALKHELNHARAKIKQLLRDQQANRREINELMELISEDNIGKKNKEQEHVDELEGERKLRKRSESLHRKLARELFEIKVALSTTAKELERERKSREVLEELCDEFAKGVKEYNFRCRSHLRGVCGDPTVTTIPEEHDNLLLHISETWLDERMQVKDTEAPGMDTTIHKTFVVEKLRQEIEAFLSARKVGPSKDLNETRIRRCSLESIPEISKASLENYDEQEEIVLLSGKTPPSLQMSDIQTTPLEFDTKMKKLGEGTSTEINMLQKSDIYDSIKDEAHHRRKSYYDEGQGSNSKTVDRLMSELLLSEEGMERSFNNSWLRNMASESSSKMQKSGNDNSLKAKLQEPKTKGQRSRLKIFKG